LSLDIRANARVQCGLLHMYESIPWNSQRVESAESVENDSRTESNESLEWPRSGPFGATL
jgi:hypothetical protein